MNGTPSRKPLLVRARRPLILALKLAVVVGALGYLFASERLRLSDLRIAEGGWKWFAATVLTVFVILTLCHVRYWMLLKASGVSLKISRVLRAGYIGSFLNASFAGGLGFLSGDAIKAAYLMRGNDQRSTIASVTLLDRIIGTTGLLTLAAFALQVGWETIQEHEQMRQAAAVTYGIFAATGLGIIASIVSLVRGRRMALVVWAVVGVAAGILLLKVFDSPVVMALWLAIPLLLLLIAPSFLEGASIHRFLGRFGRLGTAAKEFIETITNFSGKSGTVATAYGMSVFIHFLWITGIYLASRGIATPAAPSFRHIWFAAPPANLMSILPLPAGGLGVGEVAFDSMLRFCVTPGGVLISGGAAIYLSFRILLTIACLLGFPFFIMTPKDELKPPSRRPFKVVADENGS